MDANFWHLILSGSWNLYFGPQGEVKSIDEAKGKFQCISASVPGDVYLDLLKAGLIEDPFFGKKLSGFKKI